MSNVKSKARQLDQFDTKSNIARECSNFLLKYLFDKNIDKNKYFWIEPSAGKGNFLPFMPKDTLALDIDPRNNKIIKADFMEWVPKQKDNLLKYIILGNPPFGKNSSLALKFINHASEFADIIAFILPRTFEKESLKNRVNLNIKCVKEKKLTDIIFEHENKQINVPVVFQIWQRLPNGKQRIKKSQLPLVHKDFEFLSDPNKADFAFQRVGANAGLISKKGLKKAKSSHYFIKSNKEKVLSTFKKIDWEDIKYKTAGNPSISKRELIFEYTKLKGK